MKPLNQKTSQSLIVSLVVHGILILVLSAYFVTQTQQFQDFIDISLLKEPAPPKPRLRKPVAKPLVRPTVPTQSTVVVEQVEPTPRAATVTNIKTPRVATEQVVEIANRPLRLNVPQHPHRPKRIDPTQPIPDVVTHVELPTSDAPGTLAFSALTPNGGGGGGRLAKRGISGVQNGAGSTGMFPKGTPAVHSLLNATDAEPSALEQLVGEMRLGNQLVVPMRSDELGARIYTDPSTKMPVGNIQLCYVRFRELGMNPLFEVDPTALSFLVRWMSGQTRIRAQIAGRTLYIDDMRILESPMLYFNGIRPVHLRPSEKEMLRRYLVEKGGFIFVDDDRAWGSMSDKAFANTMRAQFREILAGTGARELFRIPNDHPIWNQPFNLGGQPANPNVQWGTRTYPMAAFELDGRLSVVISYNDYNNGWEAPGTGLGGVDFVPSILRMGANFLFYAATHGQVADYTHYVPPKRWREADILLPKRAPQSAYISATGGERK